MFFLFKLFLEICTIWDNLPSDVVEHHFPCHFSTFRFLGYHYIRSPLKKSPTNNKIEFYLTVTFNLQFSPKPWTRNANRRLLDYLSEDHLKALNWNRWQKEDILFIKINFLPFYYCDFFKTFFLHLPTDLLLN
jgi:hypothetical protein